MPYQIIDTVMARAIQADTARTHPVFAWIVMRDVPKHPGAFVARPEYREHAASVGEFLGAPVSIPDLVAAVDALMPQTG